MAKITFEAAQAELDKRCELSVRSDFLLEHSQSKLKMQNRKLLLSCTAKAVEVDFWRPVRPEVLERLLRTWGDSQESRVVSEAKVEPGRPSCRPSEGVNW